MKLCGLQKTTLLDFPGRSGCSPSLLAECNFRCPFCHNSDLLGAETQEEYRPEEILAFLRKRSRILEGVCITGGESDTSAGS